MTKNLPKGMHAIMSSSMTPEEFAASLPHPNPADARPSPQRKRPRRTDAELTVELLYYREKTAQLQAALETKQAYYKPSDARLAEHIQRVLAAMAELTALVDDAKRQADAEREAEMAHWRAEQDAQRAREDQAYAQEFYTRVAAAIAAAHEHTDTDEDN
jgi:transcription termination factor NusB